MNKQHCIVRCGEDESKRWGCGQEIDLSSIDDYAYPKGYRCTECKVAMCKPCLLRHSMEWKPPCSTERVQRAEKLLADVAGLKQHIYTYRELLPELGKVVDSAARYFEERADDD